MQVDFDPEKFKRKLENISENFRKHLRSQTEGGGAQTTIIEDYANQGITESEIVKRREVSPIDKIR